MQRTLLHGKLHRVTEQQHVTPTHPKQMNTKQLLLQASIFASISSTLVSALILYVAWQQNPQGEFHGYESNYWAITGDFLKLAVLSFVPMFLLSFVIFCAATLIIKHRKK
jgi:ABC-type xylose transport system permease subunit